MRLSRYYFCERDAEYCRPLATIREYMLEQGIERRTVYPARIQYGTDYFFCTELDECGEVGQACGRLCESYEPRNGVNGRCRHSKNCYEPDLQNPVIISAQEGSFFDDPDPSS